MAISWTLVAPVSSKGGRGRQGGGGGRQGGGGGGQAPRGYKARQPTSLEFHRTWKHIRDLNAHDLIDTLERCGGRSFSKENLLRWANDLDALHAMLWVATGWQPGMDLLASSREEFTRQAARQHGDRAHPLLNMTPEECITKAKEAFGVADALAFTVDVDPHTQGQYISDGKFSVRLPATAGMWQLHVPSKGQGGPEQTTLSDGKVNYLASSLFTQHYSGSAESLVPQAMAGAVASPVGVRAPQAMAGAVAVALPPGTVPVAGAAGSVHIVPVAGAAGSVRASEAVAGAAAVGVAAGSFARQAVAGAAAAGALPFPLTNIDAAGPKNAGADEEESGARTSDQEEQELVERLQAHRRRKAEWKEQQQRQQQQQLQQQQQQPDDFESPEGDSVAAQTKKLEKHLQALQRMEHLQKQIRRTQSRLQPSPTQDQDEVASEPEGVSLGQMLQVSTRGSKSMQETQTPFMEFQQPMLLSGVAERPGHKRPRGVVRPSPVPLKMEISSDEEPVIKRERPAVASAASLVARAAGLAAGRGSVAGAAGQPACDAQGPQEEHEIEIVRDVDGRPWVRDATGRQRRLSRAVSGGYDDPVVLKEWKDGKCFQMVCSASGFGRRYDVAKLLTPPPPPVGEGEGEGGRKWQINIRPAIERRPMPFAPTLSATVAGAAVEGTVAEGTVAGAAVRESGFADRSPQREDGEAASEGAGHGGRMHEALLSPTSPAPSVAQSLLSDGTIQNPDLLPGLYSPSSMDVA